jgi:hypothetical protein
MPPAYDAGALLDELMKLKLFAVEIRDNIAMLVPAESVASAQQPKAERVTLATSATVLPNRQGDNFVVRLITLAHAQDVLLAKVNQPPNCGAIQ